MTVPFGWDDNARAHTQSETHTEIGVRLRRALEFFARARRFANNSRSVSRRCVVPDASAIQPLNAEITSYLFVSRTQLRKFIHRPRSPVSVCEATRGPLLLRQRMKRTYSLVLRLVLLLLLLLFFLLFPRSPNRRLSHQRSILSSLLARRRSPSPLAMPRFSDSARFLDSIVPFSFWEITKDHENESLEIGNFLRFFTLSGEENRCSWRGGLFRILKIFQKISKFYIIIEDY